MPGTPEPDRFDHELCGQVAYVEISATGVPPMVQPVPVASLTWKALSIDFLTEDASRTSLAQELTRLAPQAKNTVLRVTLSGTASPKQQAELRTWLDSVLAPFLVGQVNDTTAGALSGPELAELRANHPILAQVLADISQLEFLATGRSSGLPVRLANDDRPSSSRRNRHRRWDRRDEINDDASQRAPSTTSTTVNTT